MPEEIVPPLLNRNVARISIPALGALLTSVIVVVWFILHNIELETRNQAVKSLETMVSFTNSSIREIWAEGHLLDAKIWANDPRLVQAVKKQLKNPKQGTPLSNSKALIEIREYFREKLKQHDAIGIFIIAPNFQNIASMRDANVGLTNPLVKHQQSLLRDVFDGQDKISHPILSDVPLRNKLGKLVNHYPTMFALSPIKDSYGNIIAALSIRIKPLQNFSRLAKLGRLGYSGETYLFSSKGKMLTESRFEPQLIDIGLLKPSQSSMLTIDIRNPGINLMQGLISKQSRELQPLTFMVQQALIKGTGKSTLAYNDYRGVPVLGAWLWDKELNMGFASEIDEDEVLLPYTRSRNVILSLLFGSLALALTLIVIIQHVSRKSALKLQQSELFLRAVMDNAADAIITITEHGIVTTFNDSAIKLFGYKAEEVIGNNVSMLMPEPDRSQHDHYLKHYMQGGPGKVIGVGRDIDGVCKDGSIVPFHLSVGETKHLNQKIFIGVLHDQTEFKRMLNRLQEKEDWYRSTFDNASVGIAKIAPDGQFIEINNRLCEIYQYSKEQFLNQHFNNLIPPNDENNLITSFNLLLSGDDFFNFNDVPNLRKDGSTASVNVTISVHRQEHSQTKYVSFMVEDISAQKQALADLQLRQKALKRSQKKAMDLMMETNNEKLRAEHALQELAESEQERTKLALAVEQSPASVVITDTQGIIEYVNPIFLKKTGYSLDEIIGKNNQILSSGHTPAKDYRALWKAITKGNKWTGEFHNRKKNGNLFWESTSIGPLRNSQGEITHYIAVKEDITERKKTELERAKERTRLKIAREEADAANKAKSEFLATMSHEIRTPMNSIIGMSHLALQTELNKQQRNYLEKVSISSENLLTIINDILDFSKIEAGQLSLESIEFEFHEVLNNLANLTSLKADEKELEYIFSVAPTMPEILIGDPLRLGQVLLNLVSNAIKFTGKGEVVVSSEVLSLNDTQVKAQFSVRDTGIGISPESQNKLFKAFSQADASTTRQYGGTGLGLSITQQLIKMMGGEIWFESEENVGSTFHFTLTFAYRQNLKNTNQHASNELLKDLQALVIDDNKSTQTILTEMLLNLGFIVDTAISGAEALEAVDASYERDEPYQVILVDWKMPKMDGVETIKTINKRYGESAEKIVIIMVTAYNTEKLSQQFKQESISALLTKPVNPSTLLNTLMAALGPKRTKQSLSNPNLFEQRAMQQLSGAHILLVEDNEFNQELATDLLTRAKIKVTVANNGLVALDILQQQKFDGVLMDVQMPVMDGLTATREIRKLTQYQNLPVIALTANVMLADKQLTLDSGMNDCIGKPIDISNFYTTLAKWISPAPSSQLLLANHTPTFEAYIFPEIAGIDTSKGLQRFNHDHAVYRKLLLKFVQNQTNFIERFHQSLQQEHHEEAARMIHTLKGLAGTISADIIYKITSSLESLLSKGEPAGEMINELEQQLTTVLSGIRQAETVMQKQSPDQLENSTNDGLQTKAKQGEIPPLLNQLSALLKKNSANAVDFIECHQQHLGEALLGQDGVELIKLVSDYDFKHALLLVQKLTKRFNLNTQSDSDHE